MRCGTCRLVYVPDPSVPEGHDCDPDIYETIALDDGPLAAALPAAETGRDDVPGGTDAPEGRSGATQGIAEQVALGA